MSTYGRRWPMSMITTARGMYGTGESWSFKEIADYLAVDGVGPHQSTVRLWCLPETKEVANLQRNRRKMLKRAVRVQHGTLASRYDADLLMTRLRREGMTYGAISVVLRLYHGAHMTEENVRQRMRRLGAPAAPQGRRDLRRAL